MKPNCAVEIRDKRTDHSKSLPEYEPFAPIMDRVLVKRVVVQSAPDGFVVPEKYRQHTNIGEVVAIGQFVLIGGQPVALSGILKIGDRVHFGEYNAEKFIFEDEECELVRIQDIRGVERLKTDV